MNPDPKLTDVNIEKSDVPIGGDLTVYAIAIVFRKGDTDYIVSRTLVRSGNRPLTEDEAWSIMSEEARNANGEQFKHSITVGGSISFVVIRRGN